MKFLILVVSLIVLSTRSSASVLTADYSDCQEDEYKDLVCTIDSVTIDGCRKDRNTGPCKLKRNVNAAINIDFTPDFDGSDVTLMAYAVVGGIEKSFPDMDENACNHMSCPVKNGVKQAYTFGLKLAPTYPLGMFNVRFLVKKAGQPKCCFVTKLRIEK